MTEYDCIVVGAGPAGAAAAHTLACGGARVLLLDAKKFPRDKLCGGGLTLRARREFLRTFGSGFEDCYEYVSDGAEFWFRDRPVRSVRGHHPIYFTCRKRFDAGLVQRATAAGAEFRTGTAVAGIEGNHVRLRDGKSLAARCTIAADGATSRIARALQVGANPMRDVAVGLEIELPRSAFPRPVEHPEIHFGVLPWGYGWIFPRQSSLMIGIAGLAERNPDVKAHFSRFLTQHCGALPPVRWRGHPIPFGNYRNLPGRDHVLLAGDAAGLAEPITGEGIAFALQSGRLAGAAVLQALANGAPQSALGVYLAEYRKLIRTLRHARRLRWLVYPDRMQRWWVPRLGQSQQLVYRYLDLLAGETEYPAIFRALPGRLLRALLRPSPADTLSACAQDARKPPIGSDIP